MSLIVECSWNVHRWGDWRTSTVNKNNTCHVIIADVRPYTHVDHRGNEQQSNQTSYTPSQWGMYTMSAYTCIHKCMRTCTHMMYTYIIYTLSFAHACMPTNIYVSIYIYIYTYPCVSTCTCVLIYMNMCVCVYTYKYFCIHRSEVCTCISRIDYIYVRIFEYVSYAYEIKIFSKSDNTYKHDV